VSSSTFIKQQIDGDSLLRILGSKESSLNDESTICAESGDVLGLRKLIDCGANLIAVRGMNGYSLLHHACNRGHGVIVSELLKLDFNINLKNDSGESPLHLAVYAGNLLIVEQLIDNGANINAANNYDETPLFYAARRSYPALVRMLLQRGADVHIQDQYGENAVDHANDKHTQAAFQTKAIEQLGNLHFNTEFLVDVFKFLTPKEVCRSACVSGKWHRASESEIIWTLLGVRRWECALQSSLGFGLAPMSTFRMRKPSKDGGKGSGKGKPPRGNSR